MDFPAMVWAKHLSPPTPIVCEMKKRADARFVGKVQGVYFRDYTRKYCIVNHVQGWVMNCPDGTVRAVFEGEEGDILKVVKLLEEEHPLAVVDDLKLDWSDFTGDFSDFRIRHFEL